MTDLFLKRSRLRVIIRRRTVSGKLVLAVLFTVQMLVLSGQSKPDQVYVDPVGVLRWSADNSELHGFGVNYTLPFAHEYRMAMSAGINPEEVIRQDVYHMARLDLDLYRVHVWDTEISDTLGNLIDNDHLRLFDFAVSEMKKRGMRFIITPIAYWGNGWPEKDMPTPGFSHKYGKAECLTDTAAIRAQANYLYQFLNHVNRYTGIAYSHDPSVIGFEISNEPHHDQPEEEVTAFIDTMADAMRSTGSTKPVFYNMSHSIHLYKAYLKANIQGGTFQWYPTGLVANRMLKGNFLPQTASFDIPFADDPQFKRMAKIVYEFDPADAAGTILSPAMAVAFRRAGMQLAAQFAYDAMFFAPFNTNYGTHFMNLAYAPGKAISLRIASAVFHNIKMYDERGEASSQSPLTINYKDDLAQWMTDGKFFYSNNTNDQPADLQGLTEIAGCGSSPLVRYTGGGAYFLDRLSEGVWRLEIMPDVWWIGDPYSPASPSQQKAAVQHTEREITITLPDLGYEFSAQPVNTGNSYRPVPAGGKMKIMPGVYLLTRKGVKNKITSDSQYKNIKVGEYVAPATNLTKTILWNNSPSEVAEGGPLRLGFTVAARAPCVKAEVVLKTGSRWKTIEAEPAGPDNYFAEVPQEMLATGFLTYQVIVYTSSDTTKFPGGISGDPWRWGNRDDSDYSVRLVPLNADLILWEAGQDWGSSFSTWNRSVGLKPADDGRTVLSLRLREMPENDQLKPGEPRYAFKSYFGDRIDGRSRELPGKSFLLMQYENLLESPQPVEIGLIDKNGTVFAGDTIVTEGKGLLMIPISSLKRVPYIILPRPYPQFLPLWADTTDLPFDLSSVESLQVVIRPGEEEGTDLRIERIWLR